MLSALNARKISERAIITKYSYETLMKVNDLCDLIKKAAQAGEFHITVNHLLDSNVLDCLYHLGYEVTTHQYYSKELSDYASKKIISWR